MQADSEFDGLVEKFMEDVDKRLQYGKTARERKKLGVVPPNALRESLLGERTTVHRRSSRRSKNACSSHAARRPDSPSAWWTARGERAAQHGRRGALEPRWRNVRVGVGQ